MAKRKIDTDEIWDLLGEVTATLVWLEEFQGGRKTKPTERQLTYAHKLMSAFKNGKGVKEHITNARHAKDAFYDQTNIMLAHFFSNLLSPNNKTFKNLDDSQFLNKLHEALVTVHMMVFANNVPINCSKNVEDYFVDVMAFANEQIKLKKSYILDYKRSKRGAGDTLFLIAKLTDKSQKTVRAWLKIKLGGLDTRLRREEVFAHLIRRYSNLPETFQIKLIKNFNDLSEQHVKYLSVFAKEQESLFVPELAALFPLPYKSINKIKNKPAKLTSLSLVAGRQNEHLDQ